MRTNAGWSRHRAAILAACSVALLNSCGGGSGPDGNAEPDGNAATDGTSWTADRVGPGEQGVEPSTRRTRAEVQAGTALANIPADAHLKGMWSAVNAWPLIAVHAVLLPDGRVLTYGTDTTGKQTGYFVYDVWDPTDDSHLTLPNGTSTDIFCSSQLVLPQSGAGALIAGGDNWTGTGTTNTGNNNSNVFDYGTNTLTRGNNMNRARWYSTSTTLINGEVYIQGGTGGTDRPEIRGTNGVFRLLDGANTSGFDFMYPRNFVAPDGRLFGYDSAGRMYYINPAGTGSVTSVGQFASAYRGSDGSAAMFRPGRILQLGGASNGAIVIDVTAGSTPVVTPTASLSSQRRLMTATLLADGQVLVTGGSRVWNELTNVNNTAEIWHPNTGTWTLGAVGALARLYHSTALLMPDATVLVAGGGAPGPLNNRNFEIYYPPYLFAAGGTLAPRPAIATAPDTLEIGKTFALQLVEAGSVSRVTLVKTGSVTHSWNMEQRFIDLSFNANGANLAVQVPTRAAEAPPGTYLLFVFDAAGVPSKAKIVRINVAADPNPAFVPALANPGNQSTVVDSSVVLQLNASDPNGDPLSFSSTGLPPGLALDTTTGRITGGPTTLGNYNVVVAVSDGVNSATANFTWSVTPQAPLVLDPPPAPTPVTVDSPISFTANATGINPLYRWNFGDGSPETAWSTSPDAIHTYTRAGVFYVTVTATDDRGVQQQRTFLQTVYLPATTGRPAASSTIAFEPRVSANPRVWIVNQDNDSVSVFDAVTRVRQAQINVGTAPRSIAIGPNGMVWVTNKQSASITVIDPATLTVNRTLTLARASQPFGIAMSGGFAYVVLEGTGQLVKFDAASYASLATVAVGPNPRHVSIAADEQTIYVSRFITPPLPGENTAAIGTAVDGAPVGAEVVVIGAAALNVVRTIVLRHSDRPDFENQGRGFANYLGAAVISPDGTQAWVPSKQDNLLRGALRDGTGLNFQNTVRAISSRIDLATGTEDAPGRIDHDNASVASAAAFDPRGVYLFVALETSREVAVVDAHAKFELFRFEVGRAPQSLALSADGLTLYVNNFMDRTLGVYDLRPLLNNGQANVPLLANLATISTEKLAAPVLLGKQLFYDARDPRLARDRYMSCATCHNDGGHDGRVWDLTGFGEGLRNTVNLRGRGAAQGYLHWSNNFDEVQDFEGQIRALAGGTGLMSDADFASGTRSQPLGDPKAGRSADLDALAAYVASLTSFDTSPYRTSSGALTSAADAGKTLFQNLDCGSCHSGTAFTGSGVNTPVNIGTLKPASGQRLGAALTGVDIPTLRDVWSTAPYLHDGSAATLESAVQAHSGVSISDTDLGNLVAYLRQIGAEESTAPINAGTGTGLTGRYYNNMSVSGSVRVTRVEHIDFNWGTGRPHSRVNTNGFSVRWTGYVQAPATGSYRFQTVSDDGIRMWVNGVQLINNWTNHSATTDTSGTINLQAGQKYAITVEYFENTGSAVARLRWQTPGNSTFVTVPRDRLYTTN
ncbi:MAG TPA: PA14 domain-containing protein [Burkholderiaceae bacterium]|nr:PA14 domain-containing protein [Burkholderiaceae bacterium]